MPLDPSVGRFLTLLAAGSDPRRAEPTVEERRNQLQELMRLGGAGIPARVDHRTVPGAETPLPVRIYSPAGEMQPLLGGLIYFHGGGFVAGTLDTHDGIARRLAEAGRCRVVSVGYRLAPEHRFPAALDDALAAVGHVHSHAAEFGIDGARLGICGDSAGATLATATCQALAGVPTLALQVLLCPILDYSDSTASRREYASGFLVDQATLDHDLRYYLPVQADPADPRVSPLRARDLAGLPRTLIHTAEFDPLRDEGRAYFDRLTNAGIDASYTCHPGMIHLFYGLGGIIPYARTAFRQIGSEIRTAFEGCAPRCAEEVGR